MTDAHSLQARKIIVVHNGYQAGEFQICGHHQGFPGGAFLELTITQEDISNGVGVRKRVRVSHTARNSKAVSERTRGCCNAWNSIIRMSTQLTFRAAIKLKIIGRENP